MPKVRIPFTVRDYKALPESETKRYPPTAERDRTYKKTLYARHGVQEYWIVDPALGTVEVFTLGEKGFERAALYNPEEALRSPLLQGLEIPLAKIFFSQAR